MATTKIWKVQKRINHVINYSTNEEKTKNNFYSINNLINYTTNGEKTEKQFYTTGINCNVKNVVEEMNIIKKFYKKENGILAFHAYQSFGENEVTPIIAHEIGVKLAEEMWGDRFQVVVSTHLNTNHIHNHFVINSVSFKDGYKYYSNLQNTALLRKISDEICEEYGLKVLKEKRCKSGINFEKFYQKSMQTSDYYKFAKEDIDYAIEYAYSLKNFQKILLSMGYTYSYRAGKLSIKKEPYKRNIRIERAFGNAYSVENIEKRILEYKIIKSEKIIPYKIIKNKRFIIKNKKRRYKPKGIVALYYYYRFLLKLYCKKNVNHKLTEEMRKEVKKLDMISEQIRFVCKYKLEKVENIEILKESKEEELKNILNTRNRLYYKRKNTENKNQRDNITTQIIKVTTSLENVRKEIKLCDKIYEKVPVMKRELRKISEEKQLQAEKMKYSNNKKYMVKNL